MGVHILSKFNYDNKVSFVQFVVLFFCVNIIVPRMHLLGRSEPEDNIPANNAWKTCCLVDNYRTNDRASDGFARPLSYTDINNKEWFMYLLPPLIDDIERHKQLRSCKPYIIRRLPASIPRSVANEEVLPALPPDPPPLPESTHNKLEGREIYDSFLYDVANDKFIPFIKNYERDINEKFNIGHYTQRGIMSFVIDNDKHILYWLDSSKDKDFVLPTQRSLIAIDIKNLNNIKLLYQIIIPCACDKNNFSGFIERYDMLIVGNTIQFIENSYDTKELGLKHYQFDTIRKKFTLVHENIHSKAVSRVTQTAIDEVIENLKVTDWIDVKDKYNMFYLGQIVNMKTVMIERKIEREVRGEVKNNSNCNMSNNINDNINSSNTVKTYREMALVHFDGWPSKWDEWVTIGGINTPCSCAQKCIYSSRNLNKKIDNDKSRAKKHNKHLIALPRSQSAYLKPLCGTIRIYLKKFGQMVTLGHNNVTGTLGPWHGIYCKRINNQYLSFVAGNNNINNNNDIGYNYSETKCFDFIVSGFIRKFEIESQGLIRIPKDLFNLIVKYYFLPSDREWHPQDECYNDDEFKSNTAATAYCGHVLLDNENGYDLLVFGSVRTNIIHIKLCNNQKSNCETKQIRYKITKLQISTPTLHWGYGFSNHWHAIFSKETQTVHLIRNSHKEPQHHSIPLKKLLDNSQL